jgi:hypothetical protein
MVDNPSVDPDVKTHQRVEGNQLATGVEDERKRQQSSRVGLSPTDFLKLLPEPFALSNRSLGAYARQLALRRQRLERLTMHAVAKGFVVAPQRVHAPHLAKLQSLVRELDTFPTRRRLLKRSEFRVYADALRQTRRAIAGLIRKVQKAEHCGRQERYLARVGRLFLDAPDDMLESFIIGRRNKSGKNLHAAALARMRAENLRRGQLSEWGRRGARARLQKREITGIDGATPSLAVSSRSEAPVSNALESE